MTGFLTGTLAALILSGVTWLALNEFSQTTIERNENPSVNLEGIDQNFSPLTDPDRQGIAGRAD